MSPLRTIPDAEALVGDVLRSHPDLQELEARVAGRTPDSQTKPWIRVTQLDGQNNAMSPPEHLISYYLQLDCYAGSQAMTAHTGQAEASLLARTARAVLDDMPGVHDQVVVTSVRFTSMTRIPDTDFEPARERYVLDTVVYAHPA